MSNMSGRSITSRKLTRSNKNEWLGVSRPNTYVYGGKVKSELCRRPGKDFLGFLKDKGE